MQLHEMQAERLLTGHAPATCTIVAGVSGLLHHSLLYSKASSMFSKLVQLAFCQDPLFAKAICLKAHAMRACIPSAQHLQACAQAEPTPPLRR